MSLYELVSSDAGATLVAAVLTFATAIVTFIGTMWAGNRRRNGTQQMHPRSYVQSLQAERTKTNIALAKAIEDREKAIEDRERLSAQVATLTAKLESRELELTAIKMQVEALIRAIKRLDPNLLAAFGSDFVPL